MKKLLSLTLALALAVPCISAQKATIKVGDMTLDVDTLYHAKIGPGTTQTQLHLSGALPLDVFYLTIARNTPGVDIKVRNGNNRNGGTNTTSGMARANNSDNTLFFCGVNGDFYVTAGKDTYGGTQVGTPTTACVVDGEVHKSSGSRNQFVIDANGVAQIGCLSWHDGRISNAEGTEVPFRGTNLDAPNNAVTMYTPSGWLSPCQGGLAPEVSEVFAKAVGNAPLMAGTTYQLEVTSEVTHTGDPRMQDGKVVLMGRGTAKSFIDNLSVGDIVTVNNRIHFTGEGQPDIQPMQAVGGDNLILANGERTGARWGSRHPRTGIGYTADNDTIVMMVIDGRGVSAGVDTDELGDVMKYAHCAFALNMDGGGSSTLYTDAFGVRNRCSDGNERSVGNAIFATIEGSKTDTQIASISFADWRCELPMLGIYTPVVYGYNAAGILVDTDVKDYVLSCGEGMGEIINDGHTFYATGNVNGKLTATVGAHTATINTTIIETEVAPRLESVIVDLLTPYTIELQAAVRDTKVPVNPAAFSWVSSNPEIATVTADGVVMGISDGETTITGTGADGKTVSIAIAVQAPSADVLPVESDIDKWTVKKTLMAEINATTLENGLDITYKMNSSTRGAKMAFTVNKELYSRPQALRIRMTEATVLPTQMTVTVTNPVEGRNITVTLADAQAAQQEWTLPIADIFDTSDVAIYPVKFLTLNIVPGDASKAEGHIALPGIEVLYKEGQGAVDNISVTGEDGPATWYTLEGIAVPASRLTPGVYIRRTATSSTKVIVK